MKICLHDINLIRGLLGWGIGWDCIHDRLRSQELEVLHYPNHLALSQSVLLPPLQIRNHRSIFFPGTTHPPMET